MRTLRNLFLGLVLASPGVVMAGHYYFEDVTLVEQPVVGQLGELGIATTEELLDVVKTAQGRDLIERETALSGDDVRQLARTVELLQVDGVGPKAARLLMESGVTSVEDLASREGADLLERLIATNAEKQITGVDPDITVVDHWISKAQSATVHIE